MEQRKIQLLVILRELSIVKWRRSWQRLLVLVRIDSFFISLMVILVNTALRNVTIMKRTLSIKFKLLLNLVTIIIEPVMIGFVRCPLLC